MVCASPRAILLTDGIFADAPFVIPVIVPVWIPSRQRLAFAIPFPLSRSTWQLLVIPKQPTAPIIDKRVCAQVPLRVIIERCVKLGWGTGGGKRVGEGPPSCHAIDCFSARFGESISATCAVVGWGLSALSRTC